jgi:hypothetical protein
MRFKNTPKKKGSDLFDTGFWFVLMCLCFELVFRWFASMFCDTTCVAWLILIMYFNINLVAHNKA